MITEEELWTFQARLQRVVDGDTIDMIADTGFRGRHLTRVRVIDIDTAEIWGVSHGSEEFEKGIRHKRFVQSWFTSHRTSGEDWPFLLRTQKDTGKYGRWPGIIQARDDGAILNDDIAEAFPETDEG